MTRLLENPDRKMPFVVERRIKKHNMNRRKDDLMGGWHPDPTSDGYEPKASDYRWWSDEYITKNEEL